MLREAIDPRFEFVRYAESLAQSQPTFDPLAEALAAPLNLIDEALRALTLEARARHSPQLVLLSVPFPGNVYAAFRIAQAIKAADPKIVTVLGGGFVNTELRELTEPRVFDYFDYVTLDAGERPLLALIEHLQGRKAGRETGAHVHARRGHYVDCRSPTSPSPTSARRRGTACRSTDTCRCSTCSIPCTACGPTGAGTSSPSRYGCYWKKCSFCDVSLDYISRYDVAGAEVLADRIEAIVAETGQTGFHFVDEAAPPKALKTLAAEIGKRQLAISWWGNIRFEKTFTPALCRQLADSGCIAISGGLEVASDRLLKLMKKGVCVAQVARVTRAFTDAGILVHAYLMYGFPTQTVQDTVDALEYVRQLFAAGCIQSGFFHRFTCTVHSPVGKNPQEYGVTLHTLPPTRFAKNDVGFTDPTGVDHDAMGTALNKALYNYMHGIGLDQDVREWFSGRVPRTKVAPDFVTGALCPST